MQVPSPDRDPPLGLATGSALRRQHDRHQPRGPHRAQPRPARSRATQPGRI